MFASSCVLLAAAAGLVAGVPAPHLGAPFYGLYNGLGPASSKLMEGSFVSKRVHPNQEAVVKMYNAVWGYEGEDDAGDTVVQLYSNSKKVILQSVLIPPDIMTLVIISGNPAAKIYSPSSNS